MVDLALNEVVRRAWGTVGVPGFGDPLVYTHRLAGLARLIARTDVAKLFKDCAS